MFLFSDSANDYSDNMSEQVGMVEVKTEPNESVELFSVCNMADSRNDEATSKSKNHTSSLFKICL